MKQIINIINFIRGCEPRCEMDLLTPVKEQIRLLEKHNLEGTFLLQYDALIDPKYQDLLKEHLTDKIELGCWLEIVEPLAKKANIKWRGRYPWDWHANVGFSVGYTLSERELLIDVLIEEFFSVFGFYPKSIGSWAIDAHSLKYLDDKYKIQASCVCKEQWGTDGYTIWGGYYNGGYYPSINNMHSPAQTEKNQINIPVFRMLGSDLIYQYDSGLDFNTGEFNEQGVITLEPVYKGKEGGGGVKEWVDYYFNETFNKKCLSFAYTQAGQENSFGWEAMGDGLTYQMEQIEKLCKSGDVEALTLAKTGKWFKNTFSVTPCVCGVCDNDYRKQNRKTVWYNCKNYRLNLYCEDNRFWIRDFYLFDETYKERYLTNVCQKEYLEYDNLPLVDGARWGKSYIRSGLYPYSNNSPLEHKEMLYTNENETTAVITFTKTICGDLVFKLSEDRIQISAQRDFSFKLLFNKDFKDLPKALTKSKDYIQLSYNMFTYSVSLANGVFDSEYNIFSNNNFIEVVFN